MLVFHYPAWCETNKKMEVLINKTLTSIVSPPRTTCVKKTTDRRCFLWFPNCLCGRRSFWQKHKIYYKLHTDKTAEILSKNVGRESCTIGFINWTVSSVFPISEILKTVRWISQDAHLKRQADERERDFSIRRKSRHSVVLLKRFKT